MIHRLRTDPELHMRMSEGIKTFDVRLNDRGFKVGDILVFNAYDQLIDEYISMPSLRCRVTFILYTKGHPGIVPGYVVMGLGADEPIM